MYTTPRERAEGGKAERGGEEECAAVAGGRGAEQLGPAGGCGGMRGRRRGRARPREPRLPHRQDVVHGHAPPLARRAGGGGGGGIRLSAGRLGGDQGVGEEGPALGKGGATRPLVDGLRLESEGEREIGGKEKGQGVSESLESPHPKSIIK